MAGNRAVLPEAEGLATDINRFSQTALSNRLREIFPDLDARLADINKTYAAGIKGEVPEEQLDYLQNVTAARALGGGYGVGSGMRAADFGRQVGLSSYKISQESINSYLRFVEGGTRLLSAPMYDFTGAFVTPSQQHVADTERENNLFNYRRYLEKLRIQPEPWEKAVEGLLDWIATTGLNVAGAYATGGSSLLGGMGGGQGKSGMIPVSTPSGSHYEGSDWGSGSFI